MMRTVVDECECDVLSVKSVSVMCQTCGPVFNVDMNAYK